MANPDGNPLRRLLPADKVEVQWDERRGQRELPRRRRAVQTACEGCRNRKSRCSGEQPCTKCIELGQTCVFTGREHDRLKQALEQYRDTIKYIYDILQQSAESIATEIHVMQSIARQSVDVEEFVRQIAQLANVRRERPDGASSSVTSPFTEAGQPGSIAPSPITNPLDTQSALTSISEQEPSTWQEGQMDFTIDPNLGEPGQGFGDLTTFIEQQFFTWNPGIDGNQPPPSNN